MSDVAEKTRPGPAAGASGRHDAGAAILRGAHRPDLIRDEVLAEIFLESARSRPDHPCLIDGATVGAGGVRAGQACTSSAWPGLRQAAQTSAAGPAVTSG